MSQNCVVVESKRGPRCLKDASFVSPGLYPSLSVTGSMLNLGGGVTGRNPSNVITQDGHGSLEYCSPGLASGKHMGKEISAKV